MCYNMTYIISTKVRKFTYFIHTQTGTGSRMY